MKRENNERIVIPKRIYQARVSRSFSMQDLASLVDVTKQAISQYEKGLNRPSMLTISRMADVLHYPTSFFYKEYETSASENSALFFRSRKTTRVKDREAAKVKSELFAEITKYLSTYVDFPDVKFPSLEEYDEDPSVITAIDTIEEYAAYLRHFWKLGCGPIDNLTNIVQKNGVALSQFDLRVGKIDGFSLWHDRRPYIYANAEKYTNARIRFSIAHELGHLLMHSDYFSDEDIATKSVVREKIETEADLFASAFLLPKETFSRDVYSSSIDHFIQLKKKWRVSVACMIYRCEALGILTPNQIKYLKDQMTTRQYWKYEPLDNEIPVEKPFAHKQAVQLLLDNSIVTPPELVYAIGCEAEEIEKYCFLEKGTLAWSAPSNIISLKSKRQLDRN